MRLWSTPRLRATCRGMQSAPKTYELGNRGASRPDCREPQELSGTTCVLFSHLHSKGAWSLHFAALKRRGRKGNPHGKKRPAWYPLRGTPPRTISLPCAVSSPAARPPAQQKGTFACTLLSIWASKPPPCAVGLPYAATPPRTISLSRAVPPPGTVNPLHGKPSPERFRPPRGLESSTGIKKAPGAWHRCFACSGGSLGVRTLGLGIKSPLLCQLS